MDAPVWGMTMDDLLVYLTDEGYLPSVDSVTLLAKGVATEAFVYEGAELYWWNVNDLVEGSAEEIAYASMNTGGIIDLYNSGNIMSITPNGPFGISLTYYSGDSEALLAAFEAFGH